MNGIFAILVAGAVGLCGRPAAAHDWYPHECCHDRDCAVVTRLERLADGRLRVTTAHGVGVVREDAAIFSSPDDNAHACLRQIGPDEEHLGWHVACLFMPGKV